MPHLVGSALVASSGIIGSVVMGMAGAFGAALCYGVATVLQGLSVRASARRRGAVAGVDAGAIVRLATAKLYLIGLGLDLLGFAASVIALRTLPLFLVQSAVASSVAVTALLGVVLLHVRLHRKEILALLVVGAGLVLLAISAAEAPSSGLSPFGARLLLAAVAAVAALGLAGTLQRGPTGPVTLAVAAGLGFTGTGIAARVLGVPADLWRLLLEPSFWSLVLYGALATACFGVALQRGSVTTTAALTFATETALPAAVGLVWLGDAVRAGFAPLAAAGFVGTLVGAVALAGYAELERQVMADETGAPSVASGMAADLAGQEAPSGADEVTDDRPGRRR